MDNGGNSNAAVNPNADAIAEVKILTSGYSAEFGGRSGALINVITKSGTQHLHGTLFEFVRNDFFDARSFFAQKVDPLRFNDFGYTLGGPVFIPKTFNTDKEKLFFFLSQEWKYSHLGSTRVNLVPTAAERSGDFRTSTLAAPVDPLNNVAFPDRTIPASRFSRDGPRLLVPLPVPNFGGPAGTTSQRASAGPILANSCCASTTTFRPRRKSTTAGYTTNGKSSMPSRAAISASCPADAHVLRTLPSSTCRIFFLPLR
jgi:hypothetical protein